MMREAKRRVIFLFIMAAIVGAGALYDIVQSKLDPPAVQSAQTNGVQSPAIDALQSLPVKGKAPKTGYTRAQFSNGWANGPGCDVRNQILRRDMTGVITKSDTDCTVMQGLLHDPYTDTDVQFVRGTDSSDDVQIDHVVALSAAWQTGAQQLTSEQRHSIANDPLNLLAVDGPTNQKKSDADAATWLPPNKQYRCQYVARQIAVKQKYSLYVTRAEADAMTDVLGACPGQILPVVN